MTAMNSGLDLTSDGEDFALSVTDATGSTTTVKLTAEQMLTFAQSAPAVQEQILTRHNSSGENTEFVLTIPVTQIGLNEDILGENIMLTLIASDGEQLVYALPPNIAQRLSERLPVRLAQMQKKKPTKQ